MKRILYSGLLITGVSLLLYACSSGAYVANSSNPANGSINPLNPLTTSQFTWPALGSLSANVNGTQWVADTAYYYLNPLNGFNVVIGTKSSPKSSLALYLFETYSGNLYNMGFKQYNTYGIYITYDSTAITGSYVSTAGNSGELFMQQNDTAYFKGRFYFQAIDTAHQIENLTNGYFDLHK
jgi:uncharacterized protein DUF6252